MASEALQARLARATADLEGVAGVPSQAASSEVDWSQLVRRLEEATTLLEQKPPRRGEASAARRPPAAMPEGSSSKPGRPSHGFVSHDDWGPSSPFISYAEGSFTSGR